VDGSPSWIAARHVTEAKSGFHGVSRVSRKFRFDWIRFRRDVREARNTLSFRQWANLIGIEHSTLWRIERGKMPSVPQYLAICRWMGRDPMSSLIPIPKLRSLRDDD
jgi:DNA-binding XRE family transcriptional regulator